MHAIIMIMKDSNNPCIRLKKIILALTKLQLHMTKLQLHKCVPLYLLRKHIICRSWQMFSIIGLQSYDRQRTIWWESRSVIWFVFWCLNCFSPANFCFCSFNVVPCHIKYWSFFFAVIMMTLHYSGYINKDWKIHMEI